MVPSWPLPADTWINTGFERRDTLRSKLSDLKPVMAEAGGRKARPYLNSQTCSVGAGFIPARNRPIAAGARLQGSLSLGKI
jgi:hypothetical protein